MSLQRDELEALSRAFAARNQALAPHECPEPQRLFEAASGELDSEQRMQIIDHVAHCAECAEAWRLAMELGVRPAPMTTESSASQRARPSVGNWKFATAASVLISVGLVAYLGLRESGESPQFRDATGTSAPVSLVSDRLPRDGFLLRWSPGPAGSTYTVRLSTADLASLFTQEDIDRSELLVPSAALQRVRPGDQLLWQIELRLPDGRRISSETFVVTLL